MEPLGVHLDVHEVLEDILARHARQQDAQNLQDRQWLLVQVLQVEQPDSEQFLGGGVIGNQVHCERGLRYPIDGTAVEGGAVEQ